jgi:(E)-4-hydroxy-3-methylbut-2-enyl-diphosphate synthase
MQKKSIFNTVFTSREINIGDVPLGATNPIRMQSMTSTNTNNIEATVQQSLRMIEAGSEFVRITVPTLKEVENLRKIQREIRNRGFKTPIIADVHYNPKVAEEAAHFVEKVRINPGNYTDRQSASKINYTESEYKIELEKIANKLKPLLEICKTNGTAIRIGTNHGSLSQRITAKYGDTPLGMVESAMEFVSICEAFQFHNIVLSMKSSNLKVMVHTYRLLVDRMLEMNMNYPLHLGVTEAGNGMEGRIKSAAGIGTLLEDGIGDTIRVSLTEDPEYELPVAKSILKKYQSRSCGRTKKIESTPFVNEINPFEYKRRKTFNVENIGGTKAPIPIIIGIIGTKKSETDFYPNSNSTISNQKRELTYKKLESNDKPESLNKELIVLSSENNSSIHSSKQLFQSLIKNKIDNPVIIKRNYTNLNDDDFVIRTAIDFGYLQIDGLGDGVWIENDNYKGDLVKLSQLILQACGTRITSTEYIACPSCGRTQYNIQDAFEKVKDATRHLVGLKIAVMGCVVNGPGEMADAHYGYVGAGKGKVNLYKSRKLVKKGIAEENAIDELLELIKSGGDWKEPV